MHAPAREQDDMPQPGTSDCGCQHGLIAGADQPDVLPVATADPFNLDLSVWPVLVDLPPEQPTVRRPAGYFSALSPPAAPTLRTLGVLLTV